MKHSLFFLVGGAALLGQVQADDVPANSLAIAPSSEVSSHSAMGEWQEILEFARQRPAFPEGATRRQKLELYDQWARALQERLQAFYATHPQDPLRWVAVLKMLRSEPPLFVARYGPEVEKTGLEDATIDVAAKAAFEAKLARYVEALAAATDVPADVRREVDSIIVHQSVTAATQPEATVDWSALHAKLETFAEKYPDSASLPRLLANYMDAFSAGRSAADVLAEWRKFSTSKAPTFVELAADEVRKAGMPTMVAPTMFTSSAQPWLTDWAAAKAQARREGKRLILDFTGSDWCGFCIKLEHEVFATPEFARFAQDYVLVRLDYPRKTRLPLQESVQNATLRKDFKITGYPTIIVTDASGQEILRIVGYSPGTGPTAYLPKLATAK